MIHTRTVLLLLALLLLLGACSKRLRSAAPATGQAETDAAGGDLTTKAADIEVQTPKETGMEPDPAPKTDALPPAERDEAYWRKELTPEEYRVLREKGTERAFTGEYWDTKTDGVYRCAGCDEPLFRSDSKFDSGCGWPSFFEPLDGARLTETRDTTAGMVRTEITCKKCGGHLGHVFNDGPEPSGLRYCINSVSIDLQPKKAVDGEE